MAFTIFEPTGRWIGGAVTEDPRIVNYIGEVRDRVWAGGNCFGRWRTSWGNRLQPGSCSCTSSPSSGSATPTAPWAVLIRTLLPHIGDHRNPARMMRRLIEALPAGSYVVLTHYWNPHNGGPAESLANEVQHCYLDRLGSGRFRSRTTIASYLDGLHVLPPGLVTPGHWWPPGPTLCPISIEEGLILAGIAQKSPQTMRS